MSTTQFQKNMFYVSSYLTHEEYRIIDELDNLTDTIKKQIRRCIGLARQAFNNPTKKDVRYVGKLYKYSKVAIEYAITILLKSKKKKKNKK